jgi:hypothetical protein
VFAPARASVAPTRFVPMSPRLRLFAACALTLLPLLRAAEKSDAAPDPASLPAPARVVVPRLAGPVTIDGEVTEPVWARATSGARISTATTAPGANGKNW